MIAIAPPLSRRQVGVLALGGMILPMSGNANARRLARVDAGGVGPVALPQMARDGLPRRMPEAQGVSSAAILAFLDDVERAGLELHSFMLSRRGAVVAEGWWWPYEPQRMHMTHSLTKSVTVSGVALALAEGRFGIDDRVVSFFPEHVPANASDNLRAMTVRDLLTMRTGHDHETSGSAWRPLKTSWVAEFMKIPVPYRPGAKWVYTSAASYMLSAIVTKTTGQKLADYIRPRLLDPLGIRDWHWDVSPEGVTPGGNGLSWTTADSLKLGMLYAQNGVWDGRQLLPRQWVADASRRQVTDGPYGYHWWIGEGRAYFADGLFSQLSIVFPEHDAVLAVFAASEGSEKLLGHVWRHFPSAFAGSAPSSRAALPPAAIALRRREGALRLLPPLARTRSPVAGGRYALQRNDQGARMIGFEFEHGEVRFTLVDERGIHAVTAGLDRWLEQDTTMTGARLHHEYQPERMRVVAGARWVDAATLEMTWQFVEAAFRDTVQCRFIDNSVTLDRGVNVNSAEHRLPTLRGTAV